VPRSPPGSVAWETERPAPTREPRSDAAASLERETARLAGRPTAGGEPRSDPGEQVARAVAADDLHP
jgi:hypothetical protein